MAEWLRRLTRNQMVSSRAGSNPADCDDFCLDLISSKFITYIFLHIFNCIHFTHFTLKKVNIKKGDRRKIPKKFRKKSTKRVIFQSLYNLTEIHLLAYPPPKLLNPIHRQGLDQKH